MTERVSREEIKMAKDRFIRNNLRFTPVEASLILGISVRTFYRLVDEGRIEVVPIRKGQIRGMRCTATAIDRYMATEGESHE